MAEIFLAQSHGPEGFEKQVVIKRIRAALADDPSFVQMFIAEARVASKLNHANLVHIFDFDRHEDSYYLAMEYVRGKSLAEMHRRARSAGREIPPVLAAQIGLEVARGLGYAHRLNDHGHPLGLVHRDVTPHNVLLSYEGAVKLTDFGIAKASNRASTAGMLKGKFAYMSPEQSRGEPVDPRTDLFALGITLWELLTGGRLFDGDSDVAVLRAVQEREILSPSAVNPAVDPALSDAVMSALQRDPARRIRTAAELERRLLTYVIGSTRAPEDTDVGQFVRALFPDDASADEDTEPAAPLQLISAARCHRPQRAAAADTDGRRGPPSPADGPLGGDAAGRGRGIRRDADPHRAPVLGGDRTGTGERSDQRARRRRLPRARPAARRRAASAHPRCPRAGGAARGGGRGVRRRTAGAPLRARTGSAAAAGGGVCPASATGGARTEPAATAPDHRTSRSAGCARLPSGDRPALGEALRGRELRGGRGGAQARLPRARDPHRSPGQRQEKQGLDGGHRERKDRRPKAQLHRGVAPSRCE